MICALNYVLGIGVIRISNYFSRAGILSSKIVFGSFVTISFYSDWWLRIFWLSKQMRKYSYFLEEVYFQEDFSVRVQGVRTPHPLFESFHVISGYNFLSPQSQFTSIPNLVFHFYYSNLTNRHSFNGKISVTLSHK